MACLEYYSGSGLWPAGVSRGFDIDKVDVSNIDNLRMMEDVPIVCGHPLFWGNVGRIQNLLVGVRRCNIGS